MNHSKTLRFIQWMFILTTGTLLFASFRSFIPKQSPPATQTINAPPDTTYLSLFFVKTDEINNKTEGQLMLFGKYAKGKYIMVNDYDTATNDPKPERRYILQKHKLYDVYYHGGLVSEAFVRKIDSSEYSCIEVTVGICENKIAHQIFVQRNKEFSEGISGYSAGKEIQYSLTDFIAVSSNHSTISNCYTQPQKSDAQQAALITKTLRSKFKSHVTSYTQFIIKQKSTVQLNFANDTLPTFVSVATCSDTTQNLMVSLLSIYKIRSGKIETLLDKYDDVEDGSWGKGYEFIDALDIDSDHNPELIFHENGYESTGIVIYSLKNGKFRKVLDVDIYGC